VSKIASRPQSHANQRCGLASALSRLFANSFKAQDESIANNPYYFTGAFSTVVVVPAAYNFVINVRNIPARSI
jgi:hypothetical protein